MAAYDQDSEVIQRGLQISDADTHFPPVYNGGTGVVQNKDRDQCVRDHYGIADSSNVENDRMIAHVALQEEFCRLDGAAGDSKPSPAREELLQGNDHVDNWHCLSTSDYFSDHEEADDGNPSTSCSSRDYGEGSSFSSGISDEGEVGKSIHRLVSIPHVPRINRDIPSIDEAATDHERLLNRLQLYGFVEVKVQGDGNCQFRALSDQLYNTPERHKKVRRCVIKQLRSQREVYEGYVPMDYGDYLKMMSRIGEWGDHVTLQAAADAYSVKILVMTSFKDTCYIEILPIDQKPKGVISLSFWAEVHYNSIYFHGDSNPASKKKKRWWLFGKKH